MLKTSLKQQQSKQSKSPLHQSSRSKVRQYKSIKHRTHSSIHTIHTAKLNNHHTNNNKSKNKIQHKLCSTRTMATNVHSMSTSGFSGSSVSQQYDAVRPSYPDKVIETMLVPIFDSYSNSPQQRPMRILDLGCGTGIYTKLMAIYLYKHCAESIEYEIYPADPNQSMVKVFQDSLTIDNLRNDNLTADLVKDLNDIDLKSILDTIKVPYVGSVDELPYKHQFFDGVTAAQAYHWFCTPQSTINIQKLLTPNGIFTFCWNYWVSTIGDVEKKAKARDNVQTGAQHDDQNDDSNNTPDQIPPKDRWLHKIADMVEPLYALTGTPHQRTVPFHEMFNNPQVYDKFGIPAPFHPLNSIYMDPRGTNTRWMDKELFHQRIDSISVVQTLEKDKKDEFFKQIDHILDNCEEKSSNNGDDI